MSAVPAQWSCPLEEATGNLPVSPWPWSFADLPADVSATPEVKYRSKGDVVAEQDRTSRTEQPWARAMDDFQGAMQQLVDETVRWQQNLMEMWLQMQQQFTRMWTLTQEQASQQATQASQRAGEAGQQTAEAGQQTAEAGQQEAQAKREER